MPSVLTLSMMCDDVYSETGRGAGGYQRLYGLSWLKANCDGFFGACYRGGDIGVVAFRGSKELMADWYQADGDICLGKLPLDQIGDAFSFLSSARATLVAMRCKRIVVTGHSLGGALAQLVAARVSSFPVVGVTFNAPGVRGLKGAVRLDSPNERNVYNYRAIGDPVSKVGQHIGCHPIAIKNAGFHTMGSLIKALAQSPQGSIKH